MAGKDVEQSARYQHQPLKGQDSIRLARLRPGTFKAPIVIELQEVCLENPPSYQAVSYVWGSPVGDVPIRCDGQELLITENCVAALRRLRHRVRTCVLWIDAICIDQTSIGERNHQVALMGDVYSKASGVIIWLGEKTPFSDFSMELVSRYFWLLVAHVPKGLKEYLAQKEIRQLRSEEIRPLFC